MDKIKMTGAKIPVRPLIYTAKIEVKMREVQKGSEDERRTEDSDFIEADIRTKVSSGLVGSKKKKENKRKTIVLADWNNNSFIST